MTAPDAPSGTALGPGAEFDLVRKLLARWGPVAEGVGDDAAVVAVPAGNRLVVSTDTAVEGTHFRWEWLAADEIGWRAAAGALSDLAAMGAAPLGLLCAITLPGDGVARLDGLAAGIGALCGAAGCPIVGGDLTRGDRWSLTMTVLGAAPRPVGRSGGRPGDHVYVTGTLGGPAAALAALARGAAPDPAWRERLARPMPRLREGRWLAGHGVAAMIDVSDGLASELRHLAAASRIAIDVALEAVPRIGGVSPAAAAVSGEEYELLCLASTELDDAAFQQRFALPLTRIGRVGAGQAGVRFTLDGDRVDPGSGYDHFST
ncbi:MAG TPA: thiamine-phosphate kinase [Gemmatimonadaceae bacterium]|nr:thiamine-phosphate kinase [Gemmatimonadaceae bacterium]